MSLSDGGAEATKNDLASMLGQFRALFTEQLDPIRVDVAHLKNGHDGIITRLAALLGAGG